MRPKRVRVTWRSALCLKQISDSCLRGLETGLERRKTPPPGRRRSCISRPRDRPNGFQTISTLIADYERASPAYWISYRIGRCNGSGPQCLDRRTLRHCLFRPSALQPSLLGFADLDAFDVRYESAFFAAFDAISTNRPSRPGRFKDSTVEVVRSSPSFFSPILYKAERSFTWTNFEIRRIASFP